MASHLDSAFSACRLALLSLALHLTDEALRCVRRAGRLKAYRGVAAEERLGAATA
jgi:hypothetical protein